MQISAQLLNVPRWLMVHESHWPPFLPPSLLAPAAARIIIGGDRPRRNEPRNEVKRRTSRRPPPQRKSRDRARGKKGAVARPRPRVRGRCARPEDGATEERGNKKEERTGRVHSSPESPRTTSQFRVLLLPLSLSPSFARPPKGKLSKSNGLIK